MVSIDSPSSENRSPSALPSEFKTIIKPNGFSLCREKQRNLLFNLKEILPGIFGIISKFLGWNN